MVPEAGDSKIKTLAAGCPHSVTAIFFLCPHVAERVRGFSVISSVSVLVLPFLLYLFLIEGSLLYSIVVFAKHESVLGIHVSPPSWISLPHLPPHPTPLGCSRASVWLSWVIQQILVNFYSMSCSQTNCLSMGCSWESRYTENDLMKENCFWKWIFKSLNWVVLIIRSWGRLCYPVGKCLRFNKNTTWQIKWY